MPRYDYQCSRGHVRESVEDRDTASIACLDCGSPAARVVSAGHVAGAIGFTPKPTAEHYVHLDRAVNAQHEIIDQCRRAGVEPPDLFGVAQRRVRSGAVEAIT